MHSGRRRWLNRRLEVLLILQHHSQRLQHCDHGHYVAVGGVLRIAVISDVSQIGLGVRQILDVEGHLRVGVFYS